MAAAVAGMLCVACTGNAADPDAPAPSVSLATLEPTSRPSPTPADPYAVPAEIDAEYLNRVFEALERVVGDATRIIVAQKTYPPEADDLFGEVYGPDAQQVVRDGWIDELLGDPDLQEWHDPPGDKEVEVSRILHATPDCVFVETQWDFTGVLHDGSEQRVFVVLRPTHPQDRNPTPWRIERQAQLAEGQSESGRNLCDQ